MRIGRTLAGVAVAALVALVATAALAPGEVGADSQPIDPDNPATPPTVTADGLPTVQIDGVVWSQAIAGDTVFAGGSFARARPAGAPAGTAQTPRANFLAYDVVTGVLNTAIAPAFNAQVRAITVSPDGTRLYVGGDFTAVNGIPRARVAAFALPSGALVEGFVPPMGFNVHALAVSTDSATLYVGGDFGSVGNQPRARLAAFGTSDAALLPWAPNAQGGMVSALAVSPDGAQVAVGGRFVTLNGSSDPGLGLGSVDAITGTLLPFAANSVIRNARDGAGITSLATDGTNVYGTGFSYQKAGNFEGVFSASWNGGTIDWLADCHGDHYSVYARGAAVYAAGHAHHCGNLPGGFPETNPRTHHRAVAFSAAPTAKLLPNKIKGYVSFASQPSPSPLLWYPDLDAGTYTGMFQGPWHVTGDDRYILMGGEFTSVNGVAQQGLVRFAVPALAPNLQGPRLSGDAWQPPLASSPQAGVVRLTIGANWDRDNATLTYHIERDGERVGSATATSSFYSLPTIALLDTTATPGSTPTYRVIAADPFGNEVASTPVTVGVAATGTRGAYSDAVLRTGGLASYWRLGETTGTYSDLIGGRALTPAGAMTRGVADAFPDDVDGATEFAGGNASTATTATPPQTFSLEAWFRTTSVRGGKIVGSDNGGTVADRHLYVTNAGRVAFGIRTTTNNVIMSAAGYNDGEWHHVVAVRGRLTIELYIDGVRVATKAGIGKPQRTYAGYWRVGGGTLQGWALRPTSAFLAGSIDDVALYTVALPFEDVALHYAAAATVNEPPAAAFSVEVDDLVVDLDGSSSSDPDGLIDSYEWTFGDGDTATGATVSHAYAAAGTYDVTLTVTDDDLATTAITQSVTVEPPADPDALAADR